MLLLASIALPLSACTDDSSANEGPNGARDTSAEVANEASDTSASVDSDMPPIYVAQTVTLVEEGQVTEERNYKQVLDACIKAGASVIPLSGDNVKKLGRTYYQLWFEANREAYQKDRWGFRITGDGIASCHFNAVHESMRTITIKDATYSIDLMANTAIRTPPLWDVTFPDGGYRDITDAEQAEHEEGLEAVGFEKLGYAKSAGQRCVRWRNRHGDESCSWTEGAQRGFAPGPGMGQAGSYDPGAIILWVHPANGTGGKLTTQRMTVGGRLFDEDVFDVPPNVEVTRQGG